ncbi:MAG: TIR domain-containing protein [Anaerolineae bacterium]|nr:TIR domain-containing protein [Anaerolineae bacterium]
MQHLYVSYPDHEYAFAHRLVDDLQAAGYVVFVDAVAALGTMAWAAETRHAIRAAGAVLMILDPARGRRVGMRHEGVLAGRRRTPTFVLRRSPGDLPRYLGRATVLDFSAEYEGTLAELLARLPSPAELLAAEAPERRPLRRPPRRRDSRWRERLVWALAVVAALTVCLLVAVALGLVPV